MRLEATYSIRCMYALPICEGPSVAPEVNFPPGVDTALQSERKLFVSFRRLDQSEVR